MRGSRGVAAIVFAVLCVGVPASAAGDPSHDSGPRFLLFSTTDLWRHGGFSHGGVVWSPKGINTQGFALKVMFGGGDYQYVSGALGDIQVNGRLLAGTIMPGWRFVRGTFIAVIYGGLDMQSHRLTPDDPSASLRGGYLGVRINGELWYEPTPSTMIAADGSVSTIGPSYNARAAFGWRVLERFYVGPEVQGFAAGNNYRQFRVGLHVTGWKTKWFEWSGALGWATDTDDRDGLYGKLGILMRH
jgi:hypothetical protein